MAVNEKNGNDIKSQEEKKKLDFKIFTPFLCELNVNRRLITCGMESVPDLSSLRTAYTHIPFTQKIKFPRTTTFV